VLGSTDDLSGLSFHYAPRWTVGAGANLRWSEGFSANLNMSYRSAVFTDIGTPQSQYRVGSRTLLNARIGYEGRRFGMHLFANNLLEEDYIQYDAPAQGRAVLGPPQVFGAMIEARF